MHLFLILVFILYVMSSCRKKSLSDCSLNKQKTLYIKGICSLLIINVHGALNTDIAFLEHMKSWGAPVVSLFLFISGYGLLSSYIVRQDDYLNGFLKKRIWKIAKPYLIVTLLFISAVWLDKSSSCASLYTALIKGEPPLPYSWFVVSIIIFYFAFYVCFLSPKISIPVKIGICALFSVLYILLAIIVGYDRCWWVSSLAFSVGLFFRYKESLFIPIFERITRRFCFLFFSCILIYGLIKWGIEILLPVAYVFIPLLIICPLMCLCFKNNLLLSFLGRISYEIYLFHGFYYFLLRGNNVYVQSDLIYLLLVHVLTICSAYLLSKVVNNNIVKDENIAVG